MTWRSAGSSSRISDEAALPSSQPTCRIAITSRTPGSTTRSRTSSADWATISCRLPRTRLCNTTRARGSSPVASFAVDVQRLRANEWQDVRRPNYFWVQTAPPRGGYTGAIAEGHYIIEDGTVTLTDVMASHFPVSNTSASLGPQMTKWLSLAAAA